MLIIFKSSASGDVIMFEQNGKEMLRLLGKEPVDAQGIITVEQLPGAMTALKASIMADKSKQLGQADPGNEADGDSGDEVRLFQRAQPLLELLERSLKHEVPVTWGV